MPMHPLFLDAADSGRVLQKMPAPLAGPAIGLALGIALDEYHALPAPVPWAAVAAALIVVAIGRHRKAAYVFAAALAAAAVGIVRHDFAMRRWPANDVAQFVPDRPIRTTLLGEVLDDLRIDWVRSTPASAAEEPRTRFTLQTEGLIDADQRERCASGRVSVRVSEALTELAPGDRVDAFGVLHRIEAPRNPGEYDRQLASARMGIRADLAVETQEALRIEARPATHGWRRALYTLRRHLTSALRDSGHGPMDESVASVLDAMVMAQRSNVDRALNEAFIRTGNAHLLAASGLNVGWLALLVWLAAQPLGLSHRGTALLVAVAATLYGFLAEPNPPILRAVLLADLGCAAVWLRVRFNRWNWLAAAGIVLLLGNPTVLFWAGFQLSFVAIASLFVLAEPVDGALCRAWTAMCRAAPSPEPAPDTAVEPFPFRKATDGLSKMIRATLAVSIAAWFGTLPLLAYHFGSICPWGWATSSLLTPLAFVVTSLGFVKLFAAMVFPSSALAAAPLLDASTSWMNGLVKGLAGIPAMTLHVTPPALAWVFACYAIMGLWLRNRRRRGANLAAALLGTAVVAWPWLPTGRTRDDALRVWALAVGNGSATVIELPDGRTFLFDAGSRSSYDAAAVTVLPFLDWRGIRRIDAAFVSHPDLDHFSALEPLSRRLSIKRLILNEHFEAFAANHAAVQRFLASMRKAGVAIDHVAAPWRMSGLGDVDIEMLWPPGTGAFINDDNNSSTVLRLSRAGRSILFTGDITAYAIERLLERGGLRSDVLMLPHHGGMTPATASFIEAVAPKWCIRSSGQRDEDTLNGVREAIAGRNYVNTASAGCVCVTLRDGELTLSTTQSTRKSP